MLSARSFSAAALCGGGASVRSASAARATPQHEQQQQHRRQRLVDAPLSLSPSPSSIGLPQRRQRQQRRQCRRSCRCLAVSASAAQSTELPPELKRIVTAFSMVPDPKLKYAQLLAYGKKLDTLPPGAATEANKVRGCVSQVWVVPVLDKETGLVTWLADSDSALTKGLAALLAKGLSGVRPSVVASMSPDFITELGLAQSLTPSRNNGFLNMFLTMQKLSVGMMGQEAEALSGRSSGKNDDGNSNDGDDEFPLPSPFSSASLPSSSSSSSSSSPPSEEELAKPVAASMRRKLLLAFSIPDSCLEIVDESSEHAGHAGAKGVSSPSGETHFKVRVVSDSFEGLRTIDRHRLVYVVLEEELVGPVHALSLETLTPEEDEARRKR